MLGQEFDGVKSLQSRLLLEQFMVPRSMETPVSPAIRGAPYSSIPVFRSASTDDLDARLHEDTAGSPKGKRLPFLVVSLFLLSALKRLGQAVFC